MTIHKLKQGSTADPLIVQLKDESGAITLVPEDVITLTVIEDRWGTIPDGLSSLLLEHVTDVDGIVQVNGAPLATLVDRYGVYRAEFTVTRPDDTVKKVPTEGYDYIHIAKAIS